jgi:hypothetical protein
MRVTTSHGHPPFLCFGQGIDLQISTAEIPDWLSEPRCGRRYVTDLEARIRRGGRKYRSQGFPRRRARRKAVGRAFAPVENAERQKVEGRTGGKGGGKLPQASKGKTRDKVAKVTADGPFKRLKVMLQAQAIRAEAPALPRFSQACLARLATLAARHGEFGIFLGSHPLR